ncbi:MAG: hypothetical protein HRU19_29495 [Pseudobacteriovorax sp.]|nr:hypothetical protein [Pseudobacteriovorax sp.]
MKVLWTTALSLLLVSCGQEPNQRTEVSAIKVTDSGSSVTTDEGTFTVLEADESFDAEALGGSVSFASGEPFLRSHTLFAKRNASLQDGLWGRDRDEAAGLGYRNVEQFKLATFGSPGRVPLYRCRINSNGKHFISRSTGCEGQTREGFLGYVETQNPKRRASDIIYRCRSNAGEYKITNSSLSCGQSWTVEGVLGWEFNAAIY